MPRRRVTGARGWLAGAVGAALSIAGVAAASRIVGFGRTVTFARTVGATCLGDTYVTSNTVPNIVFEIVAGGALASLGVPVLAGPVVRQIYDALYGLPPAPIIQVPTQGAQT